MEGSWIPWVLAGLTALWFGWLGRRTGRAWPLWALGGGLLGLVVATVAYGLRHATCIPFSNHDRAMCHLEWIAAAVAITAVIGWLTRLSLRGQGPVLRPVIPPTPTGGSPAAGPSPAPPKGSP